MLFDLMVEGVDEGFLEGLLEPSSHRVGDLLDLEEPLPLLTLISDLEVVPLPFPQFSEDFDAGDFEVVERPLPLSCLFRNSITSSCKEPLRSRGFKRSPSEPLIMLVFSRLRLHTAL